jgi:hypothetical protein
MSNLESLVGAAESTSDKVATVKAAFAKYEALDARIVALQQELADAQAEQAEAVKELAFAAAPVKRLTLGGRTLTIVLNGGKLGQSSFIRGYRESTAAKKQVETLDLDA